MPTNYENCMLIRTGDLGKTHLSRQISLKEKEYPPSGLELKYESASFSENTLLQVFKYKAVYI